MSRAEPLPAGTRLMHIGLPKTGTTALQRGAALNRETLLEYGVCYPGTGFNHRDQVAALMERPLGWRGRGAIVHDRQRWDALLREVHARERAGARRTFVSHEFSCESDDEQAQRFVEQLGADRLHVAITLRGFAELLPSNWQQFVKAGYTGHFDAWLGDVLTPRKRAETVRTFLKRNDQAVIVRRWVDLLGPDRVTVVIADKRNPALLTDTFEDLLGLPRHATAAKPAGGYVANRSLSAAEVELVRRLNEVLHRQGYDWPRYVTLIRHGVIARMQENRIPAEDEPMTVLPQWAADKALRRAGRYARAIEESGCRVIGDLGSLTAPVRTVSEHRPPTDLPMGAMYEAVAGLISAADGRGPFFDRAADGVEGRRISDPLLDRFLPAQLSRQILNAHRATRHLNTSTLARVLAHRAVRKVLSGRASPASRPASAAGWSASDPSGSASADGPRPGRSAGT